VVEGLGSHCQGGQKLEVVVKGGKAAAPAPVPAPAPAKKAPALAPSSSEAPTSVVGVPAPAPSPGPSVSNSFRMTSLFYSVASEAFCISLLDCWWKAFSMVICSGMISPLSLAFVSLNRRVLEVFLLLLHGQQSLSCQLLWCLVYKPHKTGPWVPEEAS